MNNSIYYCYFIFYIAKVTKRVNATLIDIMTNAPEKLLSMSALDKVATVSVYSTLTGLSTLIGWGDVSQSHKIAGRIDLGSQYFYTMEPQTCVSVPIEDGIEVYSATQYVDGAQLVIASALKLPSSLVNMSVRRVGGGFGGKISRSFQIATACAIGAHLSNRPVRFVGVLLWI